MAGTSVANTRMPAWSWNRSRRACWISRALADTGWTRLMSRCSGGARSQDVGTAQCPPTTVWCPAATRGLPEFPASQARVPGRRQVLPFPAGPSARPGCRSAPSRRGSQHREQVSQPQASVRRMQQQRVQLAPMVVRDHQVQASDDCAGYELVDGVLVERQ